MTPPALYTDKQSGPWLLAIAKVSFGTMAIILKLVPAPVVLLVLAMHLFGALGSAPKAWHDLKQLSWKTIGKISALGLAIVATDLTYFFSVRMMDVSVATLLRWIAPVLLAAAVFFSSHQKNSRAVMATLVSFVGLVLLLSDQGIAFGTANLTGIVLALLSAISVAIYWYGSKQLLRYSTPMTVMFLRSLVACVVLLPLLPSWTEIISWWPQAIVFGIGYGLIASYLDTVGIQRTAVTQVGLIGYLVPLTSVLGAALLLGEVITPLMAVGGILILASGLWVRR